MRLALLASASIAAFVGATGAAHSQTTRPAATATLEEIIVTAQKRDERLQDVPIAVSAFTEAMLAQGRTAQLMDLTAKMPNVQLSQLATFPDAGTFTIRGLSYADVESSFEPTVGVEVDGVYFARSTGYAEDLYDIDSIEVLRGPQGTLYGRNSIGGVVAIRTKRPDGDFGARAQLTFGDRGRVEVRAALEGPLIKDVLAAKISILSKSYDGYIHDLTDGRTLGSINSLSERVTLAYTPSDHFNATLIVDHTRDRDGGVPNGAGSPSAGTLPAGAPNFLISSAFHLPANPADGPWDVRYSGPMFYNYETGGAALEANWDLGAATITSVTGYRLYDDHDINEYSGSGIDLLKAERSQEHDQVSQEFRLASNGDVRLKYVLGVYLLRQKYGINNHYTGVIFPPGGSVQHAEQLNDAAALFGQLDYKMTDALTLTAGGRYSYEVKKFANRPLFIPTTFNYKGDWGNFSPKLGANYRFSPDLMAYATYSKGFRSGGFAGRAGSQSSAGPYAPETVSSYEVGFKSEALDHRLRLNADIFDSDYKNVQIGVQQLVPGTTNVQETVVKNIGAEQIYGAEAELHGIMGGGFTADVSVGYLHAKYTSFTANLYGNCGVGTAAPQGIFCGVHDYSFLPVPRTPTWNAGLTLNYERETPLGDFNANASAVYTAKYYTSLNALDVGSNFSLRPTATIYNAAASMTFPGKHYKIGVWVKNLTNEAVLYSRSPIGVLAAIQAYDPPRTWGVDLSAQF